MSKTQKNQDKINISEPIKAIESPETINKAIEILSILRGKTIDECVKTLGLARELLFTNSNF